MILVPPDWSQERLEREIRRVEVEHGICGGHYYAEYLRLLRERLECLRNADRQLTT